MSTYGNSGKSQFEFQQESLERVDLGLGRSKKIEVAGDLYSNAMWMLGAQIIGDKPLDFTLMVDTIVERISVALAVV